MAYEKQPASRDQSVRSDQWKQSWEDEEELEGEAPDAEARMPGKRTRTQGKRGTTAWGPGKSPRTQRIMDEMVARDTLSPNAPTAPVPAAPATATAGVVLRKAASGHEQTSADATQGLDELLTRSAGAPLDSDLALRMGAALGHDVSHVLVHRDDAAAAAAAQLGARAFTVGTDVFFARGEYAPGTAQGDELLAHELVHVKQADEGRLPERPTSAADAAADNHADAKTGADVAQRVSSPSDAAEREADGAAAQVVARARGLVDADAATEAVTSTQRPGLPADATTNTQRPGLQADATTGTQRPGLQTAAGPKAQANTGRRISPAAARRAVIHRTPAGGNTTADVTAEEAAQPLTLAEVEGLLQSEFGISGPTLLSYIAPDHEGKVEADIQALDKDSLIRDGRSAWRSAVGDDGAYLRALAGEIGDSQAGSKLAELEAESNWDPAADPATMLQSFYSSVASAAESSEYLEGNLYSAEGGPFASAAGSYTQKGRPIEVTSGSDLLFRYGGPLLDFFRQNLTAGYRSALVTDINQYLAPEYQGLADADSMHIFWYWEYLFQSGNYEYQGNVEQSGSYQGAGTSTWWPGVELREAASLASAGFGNVIDLAGATRQAPAATGGYVDINLDPTALADSLLQIRKPTAMDGLTSAQYTPPAATEWAIVGGAAPPLVAPTVPQAMAPIEWLYVTLENMAIVWYNMKNFMDMAGNAQGKALFSDENNPRLIMLNMLGQSTEVTVPPTEGAGSQSVQSPGVEHPGAQVTSVDVNLDESGTLQGGTAHVDVQGGGAIEAQDATLAIEPTGGESGNIATEVENASSSLGEIIDGISVSGRLIEGGVEGIITIAGGTIAGVTLENGTVTVRYVDGQITGEGSIGINAAGGKLVGTINVVWDGAAWTLTGQGTVSELLPGVEPFDVAVDYAGGLLTISANGVAFTQEIGAVTITGNLDNLTWSEESGSFSGSVQLEADLGTFGTASGTAVLADNAVSNAAITYTSPELAYPATDPVLGGSLTATFTYEGGRLAADFAGTANINLGAAMANASSLALAVDASLSTDGNYAGTIQTTERLTLGNHFAVNGLTLTVGADGAISGDFAIEVIDVAFLQNASVTGSFGPDGLTLGGALTIAQTSVGGVDITGGSLTLSYEGGAITGTGTLGISVAGGKLSGDLDAGYDGAAWTISGTAQVNGLIPGLETFDVDVNYANDNLTISAESIEFNQQMNGITLSGTASGLNWDQTAGAFNGSVVLNVDLGLFGAATATATIANNVLSSATVDYANPEIRYPATGDAPFLTGAVESTLNYTQEGISGTFSGTANLALGNVGGADSQLGLAVNASLANDGSYSGTIATTAPLNIGPSFVIDSMTLNLAADGALSGDFAVNVVDVSFLQSASIAGSVDENGMNLDGTLNVAATSVSGVDITSGTVHVVYEGGAITGTGSLGLSAAGGKLTGTVDAGYDGASWTVNGTAQVSDLIPGLEAFDVQVGYANDNLTIAVDTVEFNREMNGITISGSATGLTWDQAAGAFNGSVALNVDLGLFGAATANATIANNVLTSATVEYANPEIRYPATGDTPFLTGAVESTLTYTQEGISGTFSGTANFALGGVGGADSDLGLAVNATLANDGSYSGSIASTEPLNIGPNFVIDAVTLNLGAEGALSGDFAIRVVDVPFIESASITGSVNENGLELGGAIDVSSGSIGGVDVTGGTINVAYANGAITGSGDVSLSALGGKITGTVTAGYDGTAWTMSGTAQVTDLIPNLETFDVSVAYGAETGLVIGAENVSYSQDIGALTFSGTLSNITWDTTAGSFSGGVALDVDLGLFGAATATATIANNQLENWVVTYTSPELTYPAGSESPLFNGTMSATLAYANDALSGSFTGTARLAMPELGGQAISDLGLQVNATLNPDGTYSGTIQTTETLEIGDYFAIPGISATLDADGNLSGEFSVEVRNLPYLENAAITCAIDENGMRVTAASGHAAFGDENSRASGSLDLSYAEGDGFIIGGSLAIKLAENMIATGTMSYTTATNEVSAELGMEAIPLLDMMGEQRTLLEFDKQVIIFSLYQILGLYLDIGFDLGFDYNMSLSATPELTLSGLSLEDFSFEEASAEVGFLGALSARLVATPNLGVGIFVLHPSLLRGGGGVGVPIVAEAVLTPSATFGISFAPQGGVDGDATLGLSLTFEVKGSVVPYAEFSVLDGAIEETWQGDSLADFEILPKRELLNYVIDFNNLGEEPAAPDLPTTLQEPTAQTAGTTLEQDAGTAAQTPVAANRDAGGAQPGAQEEAGEGPGGLDIGGLVGGLASGGSLGAIRGVLDAAAGVWDSIQGNIQAVKDFFANWFTSASQTVVDALNTIRERGFVGLLSDVLRAQLGEDVYYIFEPLLEAAGDLETQLVTLLTTPIAEFNFDTMLDIISGLLGLAWNSIGALISAVGTVVSRAAAAGERLVGHLVSEGKIGVRRHSYYVPLTWIKFLAADEYKIHVAGVDMDFRNGDILLDPRNAVAAGLHGALEGMGSVPPTDTSINDYTGDPYNNYWV